MGLGPAWCYHRRGYARFRQVAMRARYLCARCVSCHFMIIAWPAIIVKWHDTVIDSDSGCPAAVIGLSADFEREWSGNTPYGSGA